MIKFKKVKKKDKPLLIEFKLLTINPYINNNIENLKVINYVNNFMNDHYDKGYLIYVNFKLIGAYLIVQDVLDMFYIKEEYRNKGYGTKVMNKIKDKFEKVWVMKDNVNALNFYKKFSFVIFFEEENRYLLKRS